MYRRLFGDAFALWRQSKQAALLFYIAGILLVIMPIVLLQKGSALLDALIGARGIHVVTSDVQRYFWYVVICCVIYTAAHMLAKTFEGKLGTVMHYLSLAGLFLFSAIVFFPQSIWLVAAMIVGMTICLHTQWRAIRVAYIVTTFLWILMHAYRHMTYIVDAQLTVGEGLYVIALGTLLGATSIIILLQNTEHELL